jgi:acyl-CoA synthetase (NDP forming)
VLSVFMQARGVPEALRAPQMRIPSFAFPEDAAIALARAARYGEWLARPFDPHARPAGLRSVEAAGLVRVALARGGGWLGPVEVAALLSCYGLPAVEQRVAASAEEAEAAAGALGRKVALKAIAPGLVHRTEAGAVRLGLEPAQVAAEARAMERRLAVAGMALQGYLVQGMAAEGVEMIVGVVHDRQFGPVVACGTGGVLVELIRDVSVRLTPISPREARSMIDELRTAPLLAGYRGSPERDVAALADVIVRVGALVDDLPQIQELDLNPVLVHERGVTVVDARVRVAAP